jgi:Icc protein
VLICMHHHPMDMGSLWLDGVNLRNNEKLFRAIEPYDNVRCMVWGHVHQGSDRQHNGVRMISTPSTASQFLPDSDVFKIDTKPPGYRWLNLHPDGSIETEVVWL